MCPWAGELTARVSNMRRQGYQGILIFAQDPGSTLSEIPYASYETLNAIERYWGKHLPLDASIFLNPPSTGDSRIGGNAYLKFRIA
jgi:hypothetical protein